MSKIGSYIIDSYDKGIDLLEEIEEQYNDRTETEDRRH